MRTPRILFTMGLAFFFCPVFLLGQALQAQVSPGQEEEYTDAKLAIEAAQKAQAEKFAPEPLRQGKDLLTTAEHARQFYDTVKFTQASRLARAYAELAKAIAELRMEEERLAKIHDELQKAKAEIDRLKKSQ